MSRAKPSLVAGQKHPSVPFPSSDSLETFVTLLRRSLSGSMPPSCTSAVSVIANVAWHSGITCYEMGRCGWAMCGRDAEGTSCTLSKYPRPVFGRTLLRECKWSCPFATFHLSAQVFTCLSSIDRLVQTEPTRHSANKAHGRGCLWSQHAGDLPLLGLLCCFLCFVGTTASLMPVR